MRLLHTRTGRFHTFDDPRHVRYAILSHVWARPSDAHYPELNLAPGAPVSVVAQFTEKIRRFCEIALEHHYEYAWADGCCIDQSSSSELSEAINSMYDWYRYAGVCYAYLHDVSSAATTTTAGLEATGSAFRESRWHRRGWTLQELLAPSVVVFLSKEWNVIGSKHTLADLIQAVTGIDRDVLTFQRPLESFSVACRMSWAASRKTSKEEDEAYSLMGIFGVNMPTTYGEGRYAFIRLQEEILKHISDQTIFAWGPALPEHNFAFHHPNTYRASSDLLATFSITTSSPHQYLLASSPKDFRYSSNLVSIKWDEFMRLLGAPLEDRPTYMTTSYGVRTRLPILSVRAKHPQTNVPTCVALLACKDVSGSLVALLLRAQPRRPEVDYFVGAVVGQLGEVMGSIDTIDPFSM
ncbi:heterokaryon incompatibility protein-domain-containing protein, partial [Trametes elegans]